ncbi:hypothetical protein Hanom_Chr00s042701g01775101 [Helianthus anomalus]
MLRQIRYTTNATYATVKTITTEVKATPLTSSAKNCCNRYPFIAITKAATSHETVCKP